MTSSTRVDSSRTTQYFWDFENRLTSVTLSGSGGTVSFKYDPFSRRIYKSTSSGTSVYAYDGDNLIEETNSSGTVVARYAQGLSTDEPLAMLRSSTTSYYHADGLSSISSLSNAAGSIANTYTYDSFGKLTASTGSLVNPFRFTARDFDTETNLQFSRNRYYDPNVGCFMSEDPTWEALKNGNLYLYVDNDPTTAIDPSGLTSIFYDGKDIRVFDNAGRQLLKCRGTSGRPGRGPADQGLSRQGPLPKGSYWIDPSEISCVTGFRYWFRNKLGDWGHCRVVLHPFRCTNTYDRGREGFFLHGGVTPGSAGCLDSGDCDTNIFKILGGSGGPVRVDVNYTQFQPF